MRNLTKAQILEQVDFYDVYKKYLDLSGATQGKEGWVSNVRSPFREDNNPSFTFNIHHGGWKDFGTGESGDIFTIIEKSEHTDFKGALKYLQDNYIRNGSAITEKPKAKTKKEPEPKEPIKDGQLRQYTKNLLDNIYPEASEVIFKRGITERIIKKYRIGVTRYYYKKIGRDVDEVIIPFKFDESGNAVEYKKIKYYNGSKAVEIITDGISTTEKLFAYTSGSAQLFPIDELENNELVLVEGELDALALISKGINAVTGTAGAGTFTSSMADELTNKKVTIFYDNDKAGFLGTNKVIGKLHELTDELFVTDWKYFENTTDGGFKVPDGYDVSEYFADGKELKHLKTAIKKSKRVEIANSTDNELPEGEVNAEELAEFIYHNVGSEEKPKYILVHEKLVNHIMTIKKICSTDIKNRIMFFEYKDGFWNAISRKKMINEISKMLYYFTRSRELREITNLLADKTYIDPEMFNSQLHLVNLENGTYNTRTMKMENFNPNHYFTSKNSYKYDPDAKAPIFMNELKKYSLNDQEWIDVLGEIFGYCLVEGYPIQKMFWWFGGGRNGKGTLIRVLENLVGPDFVLANLNPTALDGQFEKVGLKGKKMAFEPDMATYLPNTHVLKQLTGGDTIRSDQKFMDTVSFVNQAKIILAMNNMVQVHPGQSLTAIFRRIVLLPFEYQISEKDEDSEIEDKFKKELPGIFNWAIESLKRLKKNKRFTICKRGESIIKMHKNTVNAFMHFFDSKVVFEEGASVWSYEIWNEYTKFMEENYGKYWASGKNFDVIVSPYSFGKEITNQFSADYPFMRSKGEYSREKGGKRTKYYGLRMMTTTDLHEIYGLSDYEEEDEELDEVPF